jgi:hypothetical protein
MHWVWLELELRRWRAAGRYATLWWRDDDARSASPQLDRLLSAAEGTPLTLAVIPDGDLAALAVRLADATGVSVVQHGVDHENRRLGREAGEFPHDWRRIRVATQVRAGWKRLSALPGALQMYVPPWNDVHPELPAVMEDCSYIGWSAWGQTVGEAVPRRVDAHLDLMRWKGGERFRGEARFLADLRRLLVLRRRTQSWGAPIGLLTHHLVHDEPAWNFLRRFTAWSAARPDVVWRSLPQLVSGEIAAVPAARPRD